MTMTQTSMRLLLSAVLMISAGCATRGAQAPMAGSGDQPMPTHNQAQLLAAARQYEKEGRPDLATRYYRQVLKLDPQNADALTGLDLVQSGQLRTETSYREIVASAEPQARPRLRSRAELAAEKSQLVARRAEIEARSAEIDEKTAQIIANAAATATAQAIANAVAKATEQYVETSAKEENRDDVASNTKPASDAQPEFELASVDTAKKPTVSDAPAEEAAPESAPAPSAIQGSDVVNLEVVTNEKIILGPLPEPEIMPPAPAEAELASAADVTETISDAVSPLSPEQTHWEPASLTRLCIDANAAVLCEVTKLESDDPAVRNAGLYALAQMGPDAASASLAVRMLFNDTDELVRAHAAWTAWELTGDVQTASEPLTALLESGNPDVVQFASYTLADLGENARPALPSLQLLMESDDRRIRLHAAETIAQIAPPEGRAAAIDELVILTAAPNAEIRTLAILALGCVVHDLTPEVRTALTSALHDSDAEVRTAAVLTLGGFGEAAQGSIEDLQFVLESDRQDVRQAAAAALDCIQPSASVER